MKVRSGTRLVVREQWRGAEEVHRGFKRTLSSGCHICSGQAFALLSSHITLILHLWVGADRSAILITSYTWFY
jgi:hypothetical protein